MTAHELASTPDTVLWGWLPNRDTPPVLRVRPGDVVTVDTVSHEGLMEDQGGDPVAWFARFGVHVDEVLDDARVIAAHVEHVWGRDGPHVVTGPVDVDGAMPGDVLVVDALSLEPRVPYGMITNRHGLGALAGELPAGPGSVSTFCRVEGGRGVLPFGNGRAARFPLAPFMGLMAVAPDTSEPVHSVPPGPYGGNLDVNELVAGSRLYLPVQVEGARFSTGDPHFAQGDGEVCLTALEAPLRATFRLSLLQGAEARRLVGALREPMAETDTHWIPMGLDVDLDEALRNAVRAAIRFLEAHHGMEPQLAYAYLSAAADFEISQVVDRVKGVHCLIRKADFG